MGKDYGMELILDLHKCDVSTFNRKSIKKYLKKLCDEVIFMEREALHWWDYHGVPEEEQPKEVHLRGTSVVQFIKTSNIVIHTLDLLGNIYINIFSCKPFDPDKAREFTADYFKGKVQHIKVVRRK